MSGNWVNAFLSNQPKLLKFTNHLRFTDISKVTNGSYLSLSVFIVTSCWNARDINIYFKSLSACLNDCLTTSLSACLCRTIYAHLSVWMYVCMSVIIFARYISILIIIFCLFWSELVWHSCNWVKPCAHSLHVQQL